MKNSIIGGIIMSESPIGTSWMMKIQSNQEVTIRKIWSRNKKNTQGLKQAFPDAALVSEISGILQDPEIGLVLVVPPLQIELPVIGQVLQAGKHVRIL